MDNFKPIRKDHEKGVEKFSDLLNQELETLREIITYEEFQTTEAETIHGFQKTNGYKCRNTAKWYKTKINHVSKNHWHIGKMKKSFVSNVWGVIIRCLKIAKPMGWVKS